MKHAGQARTKRDDGHWKPLFMRIDRTITALGDAEINLRDLRLDTLPRMVESLAAAVAGTDSLRAALMSAAHGDPIVPALEARLKRLGYAIARVGALHQAAMKFHVGLVRLRHSEMAQYDAVGVVCDTSVLPAAQHSLEARG